MSTLKPVFCALVVLLTLATPCAAQNGLAGTWDITLTTPQGPANGTLTVVLDGEKVTGSVATPVGALPITGTAKENLLSAHAAIDFQGISLSLALNAALEGEALNGTLKAGDLGEFPFKGTRAADKADAAPSSGAAASAVPGDPANVSGTWNLLMAIDGLGQLTAIMVLTQDGSQVTGEFRSVMGSAPVKGTMTGSTLRLEMQAEIEQDPVSAVFTGEVGADGIAGKATLGPVGEADWTAARER